MIKVSLALRKAYSERNWKPVLNDKATDLLLREQAVAGGTRQAGRQITKRETTQPAHDHCTTSLQGQIDERLVAFHQSHAAAVEQYRKLYVKIIRAGQEHEIRTVLISSALAAEGKTVTALNLAITMAMSGDEGDILLVETDFCKPSVHKYLGMPVECGLADYLKGDVEYSRIFAPTEIPGLTVVHAGKQAKKHNTLLNSKKMAQFFKDTKAQDKYRYVILDTSPLLLTSGPTALIHYVDATILVVRAGKTPRDIVVQTIETIGSDRILGYVFNGTISSDYYYYSHYHTSDYYSASDAASH
jgi:capsular exopolysaccharide synthesis family protein